ncbi:MAG: hypothetical protein ACJ767_00920 [Chloroflexota bacterium]
MSANRADRILGEWSAVVRTATPPPSPIRSPEPRAGGLGVSLIGAGLLALALVVGFAWLSGRDEPSGVGDTAPSATAGAPSSEASSAVVPEPSATPGTSAAVVPEPSPTPGTSAAVVPEPSPTPAATLDPCVHLAAPLTWEGAAGHRIAHVTLTNRAADDCLLGEFKLVQYVDARNRVLIEGPAVGGSVTVPAHGSLSTMVDIGNYCGVAPEQPVGIVFVNARGGILLVGSPLSATDMSVPPCNGPNSPATIQMQPWVSSG